MAEEVLAPPLGTNADTVILVEWYRQEGEAVKAGEPLFSVETDKATLDVEAPATGILRDISCPPGTEVASLTRIAVIAAPEESSASRIFISPRAKRLAEETGVNWKTLKGTGPEGAIVERDVREAQAFAASPLAPQSEAATPPAITPLARKVAAESGVDWPRLEGSGERGKIKRDDVMKVLSPVDAEENKPSEIVPVAGIRAVIFERMARSSSETAPVTLTTEVDATGLVDLRESSKAEGKPVSYNDLLIFVLARALREQPRVNASLSGDAVKVWKRIHIGLAVDAEKGLIVPVVRDADRKSLPEIARETSELVEKARAGRLKPEEMRGGTFTLTNLGMFGIDAFTPVINLPECAIMGAGRIQQQPVALDGQVVIRPRMWLSLTFDHRLIDGGPAARFLQRVSRLIEKPGLMLF